MKVLACIDSSRYAVSVCDHAAWAARRLSVSVELLHVLERHGSDPSVAADRSGRLGVDTRETLLKELITVDERRNRLDQQAGRHLLDEAATQVRRRGIEEVRLRLEHGELVDQLADHATDAELVVLGRRGEWEEHAGAHLGRNIERVIRASHLPVLVAAQAFRPIRRFLLAYDGGFASEKAITSLLNQPLLREAEGHLLTVGEGNDNERDRLAHASARLRNARYAVTTALRPGDPDQVILDLAEEVEADLLVMGAYGHSRVRKLMIGGTTTALLGTSSISMLVMR